MTQRQREFRDGLEQGAVIGVEHTTLAVGQRDAWLAEILSVSASMADDFAVPVTCDGHALVAMPREDFEAMVRGLISVRDILLGLKAEPDIEDPGEIRLS